MIEIGNDLHRQIELIKKKEISYRTLMQQANMTNIMTGDTIQIPFASYTNMYRSLLSSIIISKKLDDKVQSMIRFKPKLLSQILYGTTEFWNDILILNDCKSIMEFDPTEVKVYDPSRFKTYLNQIMILEGVLE